MRAQGRRTMERLLDAAMDAFADRGYQAARVDDIVRAARTSHGTFYLYFSNKEELLRALAVQCAAELRDLSGELGPVTADAAGTAALRRFLERFVATYARFGPVIRAWMEDSVADREVNRLGVEAFTEVARALAAGMAAAGADGSDAPIGALMALLERYSYYLVSRGVAPSDGVLDALAAVVHRGFFTAPEV
jgi:AcrR family transcriptional regulator